MKVKNTTETKIITNFGGRLTRILNGDLNSGFTKFSQSWGYDPFTKPMNLTWFETPTDITGSSITDLILAAKTRFETGVLYIYAIGSSGKIYKITPNSITSPNLDTTSVLGTLANANMVFGASMDFFGSTEKIYIGQDDRVNSVNFDGSGEATVGTIASVISNKARPLAQFVGKLLFGNGNNIGAIDSTGTVTSPTTGGKYTQLVPSLPPEANVTDIDVSPDGNYALISTSGTANENITTVSNDRQAAAASSGNIYKWNGTDQAATAQTIIPSYALTALQTYLDKNFFFSNDSFGASISNGSQKMISLPNNKSPLPNSTLVNGNFVSWIAPEITPAGTGMTASLYYYGNLDSESAPGLWRIMRYTTALSGGFIYQTPVNILTNNKYSTVNNAITAVTTLGYGKHYFSSFEINPSNTTISTTTAKFYRFLITPTGTGTPQLGVYETQTELFSKKKAIKQIRVYTEPTATGNGFQIDCIGSDGNVITNGSFTYTFAAGTDETTLKGALERVNFNPEMNETFALGLRITNTGTTNMTIKKIEVDIDAGGK